MASDFSEVMQLAGDLRKAQRAVKEESRNALHRTAMLTKRIARKEARTHFDSHAQYAWRSIDYDMLDTGSGWAAEVGYLDEGGKGVQGFLGAVLEYGGTHSAPYPVLGIALFDSIDDLVKGQSLAVEAALKRITG